MFRRRPRDLIDAAIHYGFIIRGENEKEHHKWKLKRWYNCRHSQFKGESSGNDGTHLDRGAWSLDYADSYKIDA
jgi:hypothetical protein